MFRICLPKTIVHVHEIRTVCSTDLGADVAVFTYAIRPSKPPMAPFRVRKSGLLVLLLLNV
jgi:hypothetical protein